MPVSFRSSDSASPMRVLPLLAVSLAMVMNLFACKEKEKEMMKGNFDP